MPVNRTPPPSVCGASALIPPDNDEFQPPSAKLGAVTRKGNELAEFMNAGVDDKNLLQSNYDIYIEKIETLKLACFSQPDLSQAESDKRDIWWSNNYSNIIAQRVSFEKYMAGLTGAIPKITRSRKSMRSNCSSRASNASNTSSARIKLAETKAKMIADREKIVKLMELEKEEMNRRKQVEEDELKRKKEELQRKSSNEEKELEHKRKMMILENNALQMEHQILQAELSKLDGLADKVGDTSITFALDQAPRGLKFSTPITDSVAREEKDPTLLQVLQNQTIISNRIAKHQEKAELPKKIIPTFSGENITEYRSFIQNFKRTIDSKCDNFSDCLYYLEQYTSGIAKQLVKSCSQHDATKAYHQALDLLEEEFGNEHKTATAYLEKLEKWPAIKSEDSEALKQLSIYLMTCSNNMESMTCLNQLNSPKEIMGVVQKLPFELRRKWRNKTLDIMERDSQVTFADLVKFVRLQSKLHNQALFGNIRESSKNYGTTRKTVLATRSFTNEELDEGSEYSRDSTVQNFASHGSNERQHLTESSANSNPKGACLYCKKGNHILNNCFFYLKIDYDKKIEFLKKLGLCFACFEHGHNSRGCTRRLICNKCQRNHPTVLHQEQYSRNSPNEHGSAEVEGNHVLQLEENNRICSTKTDLHSVTGAGKSERKKILCCIIPVKLKVHGRKEMVLTYAALDTCSDACFMDSSLLPELGIKQRDTKLRINVVGENSSEINTTVVNNVELYHMNGKLKDIVPVVFSQSRWPFQKDDVPQSTDLNNEVLQDIPFQFIDAGIGLIIGMNRPNLLRPIEVIGAENNSFYASRHSLGWALNGITRETTTKSVSVNRIKVPDAADIEYKIKCMFDHDYKDSNIVKKEPSENDLKWGCIMKDSIKLNPDNQYEIDLPLKGDASLTNNRTQVLHIFHSLMRKLKANKILFDEYKDFMNMMIQNGFMEKVPKEETAATVKAACGASSWYISHHGVRHKQKKTIRIVFNCSLKYKDKSLNDCLYQGPDLTNNILGVILRFRQEPVAFMGDISKMFYRVKVSPKHRNFLRFFWLDPLDGNKPAEFRLTVHVFGATSSPSVANFALQRTVEDNQEFSEEAKTAVKRNFYVDDLLCSVDTPENAAKLLTEVKDLVSKGGFHITNYVTSSLKLYDMMNTDMHIRERVEFKPVLADSNNLALGLVWNARRDTLGFKINPEQKPFTRRGILSTIHSIYDPLGLSGPAVVPAKKIFQETCVSPLGWDTPLPLVIQERWQKWLADLPILQQYEVQRSCKPSQTTNTEIHYFSDGSEEAYGSIAYARFVLQNGDIHCSPLLAKSRLTPVKNSAHRTVPRIELNGAKLSILLHQILQEELDYIIDAHYFWTDSSTVLHYINSENKQFSRFVANRVRFIRSSTEKSQWKHVPGSLNPADCISRGTSIQQFMGNKTWKYGPDFLWKTEESWPEQSAWKNEDKPENTEKPKIICATKSSQENANPTEKLLNSCSSWYRLKRRVAWMIRFKSYLMGKYVKVDNLSCTELANSELSILKHIQAVSFPETFKVLREGRCLSRSNTLRKLSPFIDSDNLLKVRGRLQNSNLCYSSKHPIILPNNNDNVHKLITSVHKLMGHSGRATVASKLREKFWIIGLNTQIRKIQYNCVTCRKANAQPYNQQMSELPSDRVAGDSPAFTRTGCDFFGPFNVINGRKCEKRYGVIFSCLCSRAVHLEMAHSLNTDSFLNAFRRFIARRGNVQFVRSDNGTNLTSGHDELRSAIRHWNVNVIESWMLQHEIEWCFQPPSASNFGGVFEREIRSVRKVLNGLMNEQPLKLDDERLNTLFCEVEAILNCKPLTELSQDPNDFEALTPNHLLLLNSGTTFPPGLFSRHDTFATRKWKQVQYLADQFWIRYRKEYLPLLQQRQKWFFPNYNYQIGDLVLLTDQLLPRNQWSLGRIVDTYPDRNGFIRVVKLRVAKYRGKKTDENSLTVAELERPVNKLILVKTNSIL